MASNQSQVISRRSSVISKPPSRWMAPGRGELVPPSLGRGRIVSTCKTSGAKRCGIARTRSTSRSSESSVPSPRLRRAEVAAPSRGRFHPQQHRRGLRRCDSEGTGAVSRHQYQVRLRSRLQTPIRSRRWRSPVRQVAIFDGGGDPNPEDALRVSNDRPRRRSGGGRRQSPTPSTKKTWGGEARRQSEQN